MGEAKRKRTQLQGRQPPRLLDKADAEIVLFSADGFRACSRAFCEKVTGRPGGMRRCKPRGRIRVGWWPRL
jgi:hypothetical protein